MSDIRKILFTVSFSLSCVAMAAYVKRAAALFGSSVSLVHVLDPHDLDIFEQYELYIRSAEDIREDHRVGLKERLSSFLTAEFPPFSSQRVLLEGDPATEISRYAGEGEFDLIIMPTHAGRFRQMLLGSTTARVINDSPCPVLTSKHAETISPRPLGHKEWICAVDLSPYAATVLSAAAHLSELAGARLSVLHVLDIGNHDVQPESGEFSELHLGQLNGATAALADLTGGHGVIAKSEVLVGPLKDTLIKAMARSDADVLIVGRSSSTTAAGRMTDLTYALVRDAPLTVLSV
jgi:nucleotide-binding universal stress UspA family protein